MIRAKPYRLREGFESRQVWGTFVLTQTAATHVKWCNRPGIEQAYFGIDGKPILYYGDAKKTQGYAKITRRYDDRGKVIEEAYFDTDGKPIANSNGYIRLQLEYDQRECIRRIGVRADGSEEVLWEHPIAQR